MAYLFILYYLLLIGLCIRSYKKGLLMYWVSVLLIPTAVLDRTVWGIAYFRTTGIIIIAIFALLDRRCRNEIGKLINTHIKILVLLSCTAVGIVLFADTVPVSSQLWRIFQEIWIYVAVFVTFFAVKNDVSFTKRLFLFIGCCFLLNALYSVYFEIILRYNPCGLPLYALLDEKKGIDMINVSRGGMEFRLQSVFGHPLSLGQYLLVFYPLFLAYDKYVGRNVVCKAVLIVLPVIIFLTGTRGAYIPLLLLLLFHGYGSVAVSGSRWIVLGVGTLGLLSLTYCLLPVRQQAAVDKSAGMFVDGLQFWDSRKQKEALIVGSSLEGRIKQFDAALDEMASNPLTGRGVGYREWYQNKHNRLHPKLLGYESIVLLYLVERGVVGFLWYLGVLYCMCRYFFKRTCAGRYVLFTFGCYLLSALLTGERPLSLMFTGLAASLICGLLPCAASRSAPAMTWRN